ncbi:MAG: murein biosynthesis integral membrane protein MurJ [Candidatus Binatia bacterium]|nr:murein biosynthesis integral membrane protein MurJ [Candidatus Binatia bacterium]
MSENRAIARAAGLVAVFTFLSRLAGLVRDASVGYFFGTGLAADAFFVAFRIPNLLRRFVAEGAMSTAFIPIFTEYWTTRPRQEAVRAARVLATMFALVVGGIALAGILLAEPLTALFAPGFTADAEKFALTVTLTRWTFPYIALVSLVALCSGILNSLRHFAAPAMSPIFLNLAMIGGAAASPWVSPPVQALAYGVLVGGVVQLALQVGSLARLGIVLAPEWEPRHEAVLRSARLLLPTVFGAAVYQINLLVDTVLASALPAGSVSYLWYADRVFEFPLGLFAVALGTAALPSFSAQAARREWEEMRASLRFAIRSTSFIVTPATLGLAALAFPIVAVLFERGAFTAAEARQTAYALTAFAVGLWPVAVLRVVVPAFYALQDTRTPVWTAAAAFVANVLFSLSLMGPVESGPSPVLRALAWLTVQLHLADFRHAGLALSTSLAATVNLLLLLTILRRKLGPLGLRALLPSFVRDAAAALAMLPLLWRLQAHLTWASSEPLWWRTTWLLVCVAAGVLVFALVHTLLGGRELPRLWEATRRRYSKTVNAT